MTKSSHAFVAGAGYTGSRLLSALGPDKATGLTRSHTTGSSWLQLDLDAGTFPGKSPGGDFAVVYTIPPSRKFELDVRLEQFLEWLATEPSRFVYISTSGVYGDAGGALVDECYPAQPANARSRRRLAAEMMLDRYCEKARTDLIILRTPAIYGPGRLGLERIAAATPVIREEDANPGNRIHVDDLVRCCLAALEKDRPPGIYNISDGDHRSSTWFSHAVAESAGLPRAPEILREEAEATFSAERLSFLSESRRLDNRKMRERLRPELNYANPEAGIRASL